MQSTSRHLKNSAKSTGSGIFKGIQGQQALIRHYSSTVNGTLTPTSSTESPHQQIPQHLFVSNDAPSGFHADSLRMDDSQGNSKPLSLSSWWWLIFLVPTKTYPIWDGFFHTSGSVVYGAGGWWEKGNATQQHWTHWGPGTARILLLPCRFRPLCTEKASISFEDLRTILSSLTGSRGPKYHGKTRPSHLSKSDFTAGTVCGTRSLNTGKNILTLKLPRK